MSLGLAKMAILHFLLSLARIQTRRLVVNGTIAFNAISMAVGILAVAFQCPLPRPWTILSSECFDQVRGCFIFFSRVLTGTLLDSILDRFRDIGYLGGYSHSCAPISIITRSPNEVAAEATSDPRIWTQILVNFPIRKAETELT
jgi:hypothetical protein